MRAAGGLALSLVAELGGRIAGHVAFSPAVATDSFGGWFALGPISVDPSLQRQGIGTKLITAGFEDLRRRNAKGCMLVGDPAYYGRFGFNAAPLHCPPGQPAEYFMLARFEGIDPACGLDFHRAFQVAHGN